MHRRLRRDHFFDSVFCAAPCVPAGIAHVFSKLLTTAHDSTVLDVFAKALTGLDHFLAAFLHLPFGCWLARRVLLRMRQRRCHSEEHHRRRCKYHLRYLQLHSHTSSICSCRFVTNSRDGRVSPHARYQPNSTCSEHCQPCLEATGSELTRLNVRKAL